MLMSAPPSIDFSALLDKHLKDFRPKAHEEHVGTVLSVAGPSL